MVKKIVLSSFLILVVLTTSFYVINIDKVKVDIQKTKTIYSVWGNESWILAATEYVNLYDGTTKMRAKSREVSMNTVGVKTEIIRKSLWKENITTIQTYVFDSSKPDVELTPTENILECFNCNGKIIHYEIRDILYDGETKKIESPFSFGNNMKIEFDESYYSKVFNQKSSDKIIVRYKGLSDYEVYNVRLFDPINTSCYQESANTTNQSGIDGDCNLNYTGTYSTPQGDYLPEGIDGNFSTFQPFPGNVTSEPGINLYINYSKPENSIGTIWKIKQRSHEGNLTIPDDCFNYLNNQLNLRIRYQCPGTICVDEFYYYCQNETNNFKLLFNTLGNWFYEESMYWEITNFSVTLNSPEDNYNSTSNSVSFNCSATSDNTMVNMSLYDNSTGSWLINQTENAPITNYSLCYQEDVIDVNQTGIDGDCGLNYTGGGVFKNATEWTNIGNFWDGNYNSFATWARVWDNYIYLNYTKPNASVVSALWQYKTDDTSNPPDFVNLTVIESCLNYSNNLQLRIKADAGFLVDAFRFYCYDNSSWIFLGTTLRDTFFYEESIYWNISETPTSTLNNSIFINNYSSGDTILWNCEACDTEECIFGVLNRTLSISFPTVNATITPNTLLRFIPNNYSHKGVIPIGQNNSLGVFTINNNQSFDMEILAKVNETNENLTMKISYDNNYSNSVSINTNYQIIYSNLSINETSYLWAWADYNNTIYPWFPELDMVGGEI